MNTAAPPVADTARAADKAATASPAAPTAPVAVHCENCGAPVAEKYCGACGQRVEPPVHSLWHFAHVALEDLTHADSRLWRTLAALLFKPGFLTREFFAGRRARYLPPVRLYLVLSVAFFLWASVAPHQSGVLQINLPDHGVPTAGMTPLNGAKGTPLAARPGETAEQRAQRVCDNSAYQGPWRHFVTTTVHQMCLRTVLDNGKAERSAILHNLPRAMFLFLPLLAGVMMLMYWWPRHYYVEHLLLFVHNHAFVFLLLLLAGVSSALLPGVSGWVDLAVTLYIAWYAYRSMQVVYAQSRWLTVGKLVVLSFFYVVAGSLMLALTSLYSVLTA
jgi:hypothetical protein